MRKLLLVGGRGGHKAALRHSVTGRLAPLTPVITLILKWTSECLAIQHAVLFYVWQQRTLVKNPPPLPAYGSVTIVLCRIECHCQAGMS